MKKFIVFSLFMCIGLTLYAFDQSLIGSWGLVFDDEKEEFIRFGQNEVIVIDTLFRSRDFERGENTIFIDNFDGDSIIIQYFLLSPSKLLFIMWNIDDPLESITLILTKL